MMLRRACRHVTVPRRRGTLYVGVLATATIVAVVGLSGLSVAHLSVRTAQNTSHAENAALLARAAVEEGVRQIRATSTWRTTLTSNTDYPATPLSLNGGTMSWRYVDSDGNFTNNTADGVRVYGIGRSGAAMYVESVLLQPTDAGLTSLEAPFHTQGDITLTTFCNLTTPQFVSSNGSITATANPSQIDGSAQAVGTIAGTITLTRTAGITARQMPGNTVFDYYLANGTWIDINAVPLVSGTRMISKRVISPTLNPFGAVKNAEGIYVIDCQGQNLKIETSRILGTLVIVNPGTTCCLQGVLAWSTVSPNYPALLVRGNAQVMTLNGLLDEATHTTNFNPSGAPYQGASDSDQTDQFPSQMKGLTYVSGVLNVKTTLISSSDFDGTVVCNSLLMDSSADAKFKYRPTHLHYPPPGFAAGSTLQIVPGTWQRSSLP